MTDTERKIKAKEFAEYWKDKGYEKGESQKVKILANKILKKCHWIKM